MKPKTAHRYRVCGTPVRTGCITCKIRRVKCDEGKPFCKRCTNTGRVCDGYAPPEVARKPSPVRILPNTEDPLEHQMLEFFKTNTSFNLSGNFLEGFWRTRVIASAHEPSIRHGLIAIASLHKDYLSRHQRQGLVEDTSIKAFAFQQNTKAISHLHRLMSSQTQHLDITLMSCIIFINFDCLSGNHEGAMIHLKAGLHILAEIVKSQDLPMANAAQALSAFQWEREFTPIVLSLGVQTASFINPRNCRDQSPLWQMMSDARVPTDPLNFSTIEEAKHAFDTRVTDIMAVRSAISDQPPFLPPDRTSSNSREHMLSMTTWKVAFDRYRASDIENQNHSMRTERGARILEIHWLFVRTVIDMPQIGQAATSNENFEEMAYLCDSLVPNSGSYNNPDISFSTDTGIIPPLFFIALSAPNIATRRFALEILGRVPRIEGLWDSDDAFQIARNAISEAEGLDRSSLFYDRPQWDNIADRLKERLTWPFTPKLHDEFLGPLAQKLPGYDPEFGDGSSHSALHSYHLSSGDDINIDPNLH